MKLEIFDRNAMKPSAWAGLRAVSVNRRNAKITISKQLCTDMGINESMSIFIARNTDKPCEWYIRFDNSDEGLRLRTHNCSGHCKGYTTLGLTSRPVSAAILDSLKAQRGATLLVAKTPTKIDGQEWLQLITNNPKRIN